MLHNLIIQMLHIFIGMVILNYLFHLLTPTPQCLYYGLVCQQFLFGCLISVHIAVCAALQNTYKLSFAWFYIGSELKTGAIHAQANISSGATMIGCYDMIASVM